ncbi:Acd1 [Desulforapulum autotrophicum HRM2]|uniref:3-methylmercaptopropionyl-CoA dehydrogenase n=1 Tax=Desulforapulum autotrophicum (strain ATCC 43914 / DSM 3382 / VKM B-1955 / HRM2) TaxID=177437 RepID=C0QJN4_DESAH|nr:acyl-CoA dehydrogenase [Desulforapulum autotrophicum]ACN13887.1 Acd1 [Desulforapulum autotrophicum HRM2]
MAEQIADQRDIEFVLYEQLDTMGILASKKFKDINKTMADMVVKEARTLAIKEILPTFTECDRQGVNFDRGCVTVPECFKRGLDLLRKGEWGALTADPEFGGQGLPHTIAQAALDYLIGANYTMMVYVILGHGAGKMIDYFGTPAQKALFLEKLYTLEWGGSMLLTEPSAGSDLGALTTTATKNDDGTYSITGNKIFITNGEQNLTDNIIHPVLARIEGAPAGTRGISIFIVPKIWVNEDGSFGESNDVVCTGVEEKMGLHGSPTCSLSLGSKGQCRGFLLGKENQGMQIMFHMMNEVRLEVGTQAATHASCAYLYALDYARTRCQGRSLETSRDSSAPQVPIIQHPDVRRMLTKMKAHVEGMRSLLYYTAFCIDKGHCADTQAEKDRYQGLTEILTPIVKAYCSERGFDVCVDAMQVFGGYGYTREYPMEQLVRDCKICSIYEGANGIQAMDFLGRKLTMAKGAFLTSLVEEIKKTGQRAMETEGLEMMGEKVTAAAELLETTCTKMTQGIRGPQFKSTFAFAHPLLEATGDVIMAWMLLWRANVAQPSLDDILNKSNANSLDEILANNKNAAFYHGKITTAEFFINTLLPATMGKLKAIAQGTNPAVTMHANSF